MIANDVIYENEKGRQRKNGREEREIV